MFINAKKSYLKFTLQQLIFNLGVSMDSNVCNKQLIVHYTNYIDKIKFKIVFWYKLYRSFHKGKLCLIVVSILTFIYKKRNNSIVTLTYDTWLRPILLDIHTWWALPHPPWRTRLVWDIFHNNKIGIDNSVTSTEGNWKAVYS